LWHGALEWPPTTIDFDAYLAALETRHLANLTRSELTRALRALSSCYVERRGKLAGGGALDGAGKRAAFALFYGSMHFLTITEVVRALGAHERRVQTIHDLGCGTGVGGAAWALAAATAPSIAGLDRSAWAVAEANWTYRHLGLRGSARVGDIARFPDSHMSRFSHSALLLAYAVNELPDASRAALLDRICDCVQKGSALLIVEPIAKQDRPWWPAWVSRLGASGAVEHEWRFRADLPPLLRQIATAAGLDPRELTARTMSRL
jgi:Methyltransferase domain